jgi:hypothetical protein
VTIVIIPTKTNRGSSNLEISTLLDFCLCQRHAASLLNLIKRWIASCHYIWRIKHVAYPLEQLTTQFLSVGWNLPDNLRVTLGLLGRRVSSVINSDKLKSSRCRKPEKLWVDKWTRCWEDLFATTLVYMTSRNPIQMSVIHVKSVYRILCVINIHAWAII